MREVVVKQTVAWIGEIDRSPKAFHRLVEHYRLIWVTQDEINSDPSTIENPLPEVEVINCAKEGCWEADIIILAGELIHQELLEKIREVSTQKIVIIITVESKIAWEERISSIIEALSFSKIVEVVVSSEEAQVSGTNLGAVATANDIIQLLGYRVNM
jgi:hypothetical protein